MKVIRILQSLLITLFPGMAFSMTCGTINNNGNAYTNLYVSVDYLCPTGGDIILTVAELTAYPNSLAYTAEMVVEAIANGFVTVLPLCIVIFGGRQILGMLYTKYFT